MNINDMIESNKKPYFKTHISPVHQKFSDITAYPQDYANVVELYKFFDQVVFLAWDDPDHKLLYIGGYK